MRRGFRALAVALVLAGSGLAACDDGGSTYDQQDPMPAESTVPSSTPKAGLGGAGQKVSPPPKTDQNGIESGDEETGGN
jgi:hypothetical protein